MFNRKSYQPSSTEDDLSAEYDAWETLKEFVYTNADALNIIWPASDGQGGGVYLAIVSAMRECGYRAPSCYEIEPPKGRKKAIISGSLRRQVFERDAYRCRHCEGWESLSVDHIHPEALGGTLDLDNLQTLCKTCNSRKGTLTDREAKALRLESMRRSLIGGVK